MEGFLGRGWKFPVRVDKNTGRILLSESEEEVKEAIRLVVSTFKGERVMRPTFGSNLRRYVFDILDNTTLALMEEAIKNAIVSWESRVCDVRVEAVQDKEEESRVNISIDYKIIATNTTSNLVYPFYRQ